MRRLFKNSRTLISLRLGSHRRKSLFSNLPRSVATRRLTQLLCRYVMTQDSPAIFKLIHLQAALAANGAQPISGCNFDFSSVLTNVTTMAAAARLVENVGVGAYLGAASLIADPSLLTAAASILTVEARHQTILNVLNGATAIPQAFDIPLTPPQVLALAGPFISGCQLGVTGKRSTGFSTYCIKAEQLCSQPTHH